MTFLSPDPSHVQNEVLREIRFALSVDEDTVDALRVASKQHPSHRIRVRLRKIAWGLEEGKSLPEAYAGLGRCASPELLGILSAAHTNQDPASDLETAAAALGRVYDFSSYLVWTLLPFSLIGITLISTFFALSSGPMEWIAQIGQKQAPAAFRIAYSLLQSVSPALIVLLIALLGAVAGFLMIRTRVGLGLMDALPMLSKARRLTHLGIATRLLGGMIKAGVPLREAVRRCATVIPSGAERTELLAYAEQITAGEAPASLSSNVTVLKPILKFLSRAPHDRDAIPRGLERIADYFDAESERISRQFLVVAEVAAILVAGALTALFVINAWGFYFDTIQSFPY